MSLVEKDEMTTLRSASESKDTAQTAEYEIQLKAVAYAINSAANTGELRTIFVGQLRDDVKEELESNGYTLTKYGQVNPDNETVISWK